jgi:hypothetical protein
VSVIRHFFGHQWYMDHIFQDAAHSLPNGFMRINYTPGPEGEKKTSRVLDFAENLFNLQHIEGFDDRVNQMRTGTIEAAFAERRSANPNLFRSWNGTAQPAPGGNAAKADSTSIIPWPSRSFHPGPSVFRDFWLSTCLSLSGDRIV